MPFHRHIAVPIPRPHSPHQRPCRDVAPQRQRQQVTAAEECPQIVGIETGNAARIRRARKVGQACGEAAGIARRHHPHHRVVEVTVRECHESRPVADAPLDFLVLKNFAYTTNKAFSSDRWCCVGDAAAFTDPLYSMGSDLIAMANRITVRLIELDAADVHLTPTRTEYPKGIKVKATLKLPRSDVMQDVTRVTIAAADPMK